MTYHHWLRAAAVSKTYMGQLKPLVLSGQPPYLHIHFLLTDNFILSCHLWKLTVLCWAFFFVVETFEFICWFSLKTSVSMYYRRFAPSGFWLGIGLWKSLSSCNCKCICLSTLVISGLNKLLNSTWHRRTQFKHSEAFVLRPVVADQRVYQVLDIRFLLNLYRQITGLFAYLLIFLDDIKKRDSIETKSYITLCTILIFLICYDLWPM